MLGVVLIGAIAAFFGRCGYNIYYRGIPFLQPPNPPPYFEVGTSLTNPKVAPRRSDPEPWAFDNLTGAEWSLLLGVVLLVLGGTGYGLLLIVHALGEDVAASR
ncbi:MAG TPA: hypothetical protein VKE94_09055 [Gemmataceae bacterium]|nr:hypothetical protein [Gemmataceae bacterium]